MCQVWEKAWGIFNGNSFGNFYNECLRTGLSVICMSSDKWFLYRSLDVVKLEKLSNVRNLLKLSANGSDLILINFFQIFKKFQFRKCEWSRLLFDMLNTVTWLAFTIFNYFSKAFKYGILNSIISKFFRVLRFLK